MEVEMRGAGPSSPVAVRLPDDLIDRLTVIQEENNYPSLSWTIRVACSSFVDGSSPLSQTVQSSPDERERQAKLKKKQRLLDEKRKREEERAQFEAENPPPLQCPKCGVGASETNEIDEVIFFVSDTNRTWRCDNCKSQGEF